LDIEQNLHTINKSSRKNGSLAKLTETEELKTDKDKFIIGNLDSDKQGRTHLTNIYIYIYIAEIFHKTNILKFKSFTKRQEEDVILGFAH